MSDQIGNPRDRYSHIEAHISIPDEDGKCGGILTEPEDQITSVDRDGDGLYDPHLSCRTIIAAPKNFKIEIIFIAFNLTGYSICFQDFVLVSFVVLCSLVCEVCLLCTWVFPVIHIPLINKLCNVFDQNIDQVLLNSLENVPIPVLSKNKKK